MSDAHPTADTNAAGENPDPMSPERAARARDANTRTPTLDDILDPARDFFQWETIREDVIHYRPFDDLPQDEQDRARERRKRMMIDSRIPWVLSDLGALLNTIDDVDDVLKSHKFLRNYAYRPLARLGKGPPGGPRVGHSRDLDDYKTACKNGVGRRQRKLAFINAGFLDLLAFLGLQVLKGFFPAWRFGLLALQFLQTTDMVFGLGVQLGPIIGLIMETAFTTLDLVGLPFDTSHNKYNQLKAARVTQRAARLLAAYPHLHPEDRLSVIHALVFASQSDILPPIVIHPADYPDLTDIATDPARLTRNFAGLAASLPYNAGAYFVNDFMQPLFQNWARALDPTNAATLPSPSAQQPRNYYLNLIEQGLCPPQGCDAQVYQDLSTFSQLARRTLRFTSSALDPLAEVARDLFWDVTDTP